MDALIIVDVQNDFLPGGSLAVPNGNKIIPIINALQKKFKLIVATRDWHPSNHASFASNHEGHKVGDVINLNGLRQILWPDHCVQGSPGAEISPLLNQTMINRVVFKGTDLKVDSYSVFFDNGHRIQTEMHDYLQKKNVRRLFISGLSIKYHLLRYACLAAYEMKTCSQ
jgi:nicotinamidase/pyrazinamidase